MAFAGPPPEQGEPLSVTLIIPDEADSERQLAQIATARRLTHPNLLCIVDGGECAFEGTTLLFVVTEATGAALAASIAEAPFGLKEATALTEDLLAGLDYIHRQGFVYRNLEPDTVMRAGAHWKLADLSQLHRAGPLEGGATGGPNAPPEASLGSVEPGWDVWALGATLRAALTEEVRRGPLFGAIIAGCLEANPAKRLSLGEIRRFLDKGESTPAIVVPKEAPAGERTAPSRPRSRVAVAAIILAAVILAVVLAVAALLREQPAAPAKVTPRGSPDRAASRSVGRPSPFTNKVGTEAKRSPAPQPQTPDLSTNPHSITQPATTAESGTPSTSLGAEGANVGQANFFADNLNGKPTASGEVFSNADMTAAHPSLPFGTRLRITNLANGRSVVVRVNDRAPLSRHVVIMVTRAAAGQLGFVQAGSARVRIEPAQ